MKEVLAYTENLIKEEIHKSLNKILEKNKNLPMDEKEELVYVFRDRHFLNGSKDHIFWQYIKDNINPNFRI